MAKRVLTIAEAEAAFNGVGPAADSIDNYQPEPPPPAARVRPRKALSVAEAEAAFDATGQGEPSDRELIHNWLSQQFSLDGYEEPAPEILAATKAAFAARGYGLPPAEAVGQANLANYVSFMEKFKLKG
jgi:hypothetical protein